MIIIYVIAIIIFLYLLIPTYKKPRVYRDFITEEERQHIMERAKKNFKPSRVNGDNKKDIDTSKIRVSDTAWLDPNNDPVVKRVMKRCLGKCDRPLRNCEHLQVVRYRPGGYYRPHHDACMLRAGCREYNQLANQRMFTFLIALNDDYEGGTTSFPNLNKTYKLNAGDVLKFHNLNNYGWGSDSSLHSGDPVKSGEKWICNVWVHTYPYNH